MAFFAIAPLLCALAQNEIQMTLYIHQVPSGPNINQAVVIDPSNGFGRTAVIDWTIRDGADPSSKVIGQAQGIHMRTSQNESIWHTSMNLVFSDARFGGSTLQVMGLIAEGPRDWSIVGGTGEFSMARGVAKYTVEPNSSRIYRVNVHAYYSSMDSRAVSGKSGCNSKISEPITVN
ncbi:dirigent protein 22 isoform X2 [Sorghum bicolor]|uniref:Dirigent protein n=1 Tax=Sorghum bicolor TaxID=4558 RepID=C5Y790_SORBI|nr:dirigent protein 22 isoform X2 [Sorghum bicolor]EES09504.1 hypothetical protein SORBI_3005G079100 [Sorghum bicolor]|eukprot:XP_002450516.1 dirigent protein 22 isoform X2 [Sorghum bicolor]